jgi:hypothetical protein
MSPARDIIKQSNFSNKVKDSKAQSFSLIGTCAKTSETFTAHFSATRVTHAAKMLVNGIHWIALHI